MHEAVKFFLNDRQLNSNKSVVILQGLAEQHRIYTERVSESLPMRSWISLSLCIWSVCTSMPTSWWTHRQWHSTHLVTITCVHWGTFSIIYWQILQTVTCTIVGSSLDYHTRLFYGIWQDNLLELMLIQNNTDHVIMDVPRKIHSEDLLKRFNWFSVN